MGAGWDGSTHMHLFVHIFLFDILAQLEMLLLWSQQVLRSLDGVLNYKENKHQL